MCDKTVYDLIIGIAASAATICIGSAWQLATRYGVTTTLTPYDLSLLRYLIPAILLSPVLVKYGLFPTMQTQWTIPLIVGGAGLPFGLLGMAGAQFAPAAHMGALLPGTMPLFVAIFCVIFLKERYSIERLAGLGIILIGVALIFGTSIRNEQNWMQSDIWKGNSLFILQAVCGRYTPSHIGRVG